MKKHKVVFIFIFCISLCKAQPMHWIFAKSINCNPYLYQNISSGYSNNSIYTTGRFYNTLIVDTTTINLDGIYIAKFDSLGALSKIKAIQTYCLSNAIENKNGITLVGYFGFDSLDFGNGIKLYKSPSVLNGQETFIAKFDSDLNIKWAKKSIDFASYAFTGSQSNAVTTDVFGSSYLSGSFSCDSVQFGSNMLRASNGSNFLVKYDSIGNIRWVKQMDYTVEKLTTDSKGNIFMAGSSDSILIDNVPLPNNNIFDGTVFVAKMDTNGNVLWANGLGGGSSYGDIAGLKVWKNKVYLGGDYSDQLQVNSTTISAFGNDPYVAAFDTAGNGLWLKTGSQTNDHDYGSGMDVDTLGRVYLAGESYSNYMQFDATHSMNGGGYVVSYDSAGNVLWLKIGFTYCERVSCDATGRNIYVTGHYFPGGGIFGNTHLAAIGNYNYFIAKLSPDSCVVTPPTVNYSRLSFCQGDTIHLSATGNHAIWSNGVAGNSIVVNDSLKAWVTVTQANGCTVSSNPVQAAVHPMPNDTLLANPAKHDLCKGSSMQLAVQAGNLYTWSNGLHTNFINVDTTGNYSVIIRSTFGCVDTSQVYVVTQRPIPTAPDSIALHGGRLYAYPSGAYIYNWYRNGTSIYLSTTNECAPLILVDGQSFTATIVSQYGCESAPSPVYVYHDSSIGMNSITRNEESIIIYPNPANTNLTIRQLGNEAIKYIEIENVVGQVVFHSLITSSANLLIDVHDYPSGIYFIKATDVNGNISNVKFVKE